MPTKKIIFLTKAKPIFLTKSCENDLDYISQDAFFHGWASVFKKNGYEVLLDTRSSYFFDFLKYRSIFLYKATRWLFRKLKLTSLDDYFLKKSIFLRIYEENIQIIFTEINDNLDIEFLNSVKKMNIITIEWIGLFPQMLSDIKRKSLKFLDLILLPGDYIKLFDILGVDHEIFLPIGSSYNPLFLYNEKSDDHSHDIVFVGGIGGVHSKRVEFLEKIANEFDSFAFYGYGAEELPIGSSLKLKYKGWADAEILRKAFSSSKIAINLTLDDYSSVKSGYNNRLHEICACAGALQVVEDHKNVHNMFNDEEVAFFRDVNDAIEKIQFFLENKEMRIEMVERAYIKNSKYCYEEKFSLLNDELKKRFKLN